MVSRQLVYVTGMLEVILGLSDPSEGSKQVAELSEASEGSKRVAEAFRGLGRRQGRRPSLSGTKLSSLPRKGPSGTSAKFAGYQENFAGGRSRPEASESVPTSGGSLHRPQGNRIKSKPRV